MMTAEEYHEHLMHWYPDMPVLRRYLMEVYLSKTVVTKKKH